MQYERAFIEINKENLLHNYQVLSSMLKPNTEFIAVLKANAYGHDAPLVAKVLNDAGVRYFAVASIDEAIKLREEKILGEILILGYTHTSDIQKLIDYDLCQSIVDYDYAMKIVPFIKDKRLKVQIQVDTGLHRLGFNVDEIDKIKELFSYKCLDIKGIYSHFSMADNLNEEAIAFTHKQIEKFNYLTNELKKDGLNVKSHIQGSYGLINYPELNYDYVRIGMLMYGNDISSHANKKYPINLKPVLSLKSHIIHINHIKSGEYVSYGTIFKAEKEMKVATICLGYKDGYPKALAKDGHVLIKGQYAKIIGGICMDQMMIDVSDIDCNVDDIVELIGDHKLTNATYLSSLYGSVACELLSTLGRHLKRILV